MDENFFILSFMAVSFEIHKTFYQNKFLSILFCPTKFAFTKKYSRFSTLEHLYKFSQVWPFPTPYKCGYFYKKYASWYNLNCLNKLKGALQKPTILSSFQFYIYFRTIEHHNTKYK